jgi:hypothetical protein
VLPFVGSAVIRLGWSLTVMLPKQRDLENPFCEYWQIVVGKQGRRKFTKA